MLLSASTTALQKVRPASRGCRPVRANASLRRGDRLGEDLGITAEPLRFLDELAALDLEDLYPAAAFMVGRGDLQRRNQAAEGEVLDRLEALAHVLAGRLGAALRLNGVADRLDVNGGDQQSTVVIDGRRHFLRRLFALGL